VWEIGKTENRCTGVAREEGGPHEAGDRLAEENYFAFSTVRTCARIWLWIPSHLWVEENTWFGSHSGDPINCEGADGV